MVVDAWTSQAAEDASNLFHPVTYEGVVDIDKESDPQKRYDTALQQHYSVFQSCHPLCLHTLAISWPHVVTRAVPVRQEL